MHGGNDGGNIRRQSRNNTAQRCQHRRNRRQWCKLRLKLFKRCDIRSQLTKPLVQLGFSADVLSPFNCQSNIMRAVKTQVHSHSCLHCPGITTRQTAGLQCNRTTIVSLRKASHAQPGNAADETTFHCRLPVINQVLIVEFRRKHQSRHLSLGQGRRVSRAEHMSRTRHGACRRLLDACRYRLVYSDGSGAPVVQVPCEISPQHGVRCLNRCWRLGRQQLCRK